MDDPSNNLIDEDPVRRFRRLLESDEASQRASGEYEVEKNDLEGGARDTVIAGEDTTLQSQTEKQPSHRPTWMEGDTEPVLVQQSASEPVRVGKRLPPPAPLGDTPVGTFKNSGAPPALGTQGMPVPRRMESLQSKNQPALSPEQSRRRNSVAPWVGGVPPIVPSVPGKKRWVPEWLDLPSTLGCLLRMIILGLFALVILAILVLSFVLYQYYTIAATLPSVDDLRARASTFETTRIFDRNGNLLYEVLDPNAGRRTYITLDKISPFLLAATIATEDQSFYSHPGFDWTAIVRAFWQNYQSEGETVSGASTITQQLARNLLFSPEERSERTYLRKVREALLAAEITRRYSKDDILELYLNEIYYGNLAYGIQAAAETYFGINAGNLTLSQASLLAGLPQAPSVYDIYNNREVTRQRQQQVLTLMYQASQDQGCIYVSNSPQRVCVDASTAVAAYVELENYEFRAPEIFMRYPHWVNYIRTILEEQFDPQTIYRSGFSVYTTLDPGLQDIAQVIVQQQVANLEANNAFNGALVAIRPASGEILAMVGSADFYDEMIDGQVNMATSPTRQPGSAIKPITYLAAFEKGWTPATLIWDVPSEFPPSGDPLDPSPPYKPVNYDGRFHGPVTVRSALANSYNVPAVKVLQFVGINDNPNTPEPDGMIAMARRLGISSLIRPDYGLSLTLGGGEVSLMELTRAYSVIANGGRFVHPVSILKILDFQGNIVFEAQPSQGDQVIRSEHAYLISSILSDNVARAPMFGPDSILNLPFTAAAKTGTTNDFRDNWTIGYTADVAVGVWVGNADYTPMLNTTGLTGAAPIWAEFMQAAVQALTGNNPTPFYKPSGIVDRVICAISGTEPSQWCSSQRSEYFAADQLPLSREQDLWARVSLDTWTGLRASAACLDFVKEEFVLNVTDAWAVQWVRDNSEGRAWAENNGFPSPVRFMPARECRADDPRPFLEITSPGRGQSITTSPLDINGRAGASADFRDYNLSYGVGTEPIEWKTLVENSQPINQNGRIYSWDLKDLPAGIYTLRLTLRSVRETSAELRWEINLQVPTSTPTQTPTVTITPTPTGTSTSTPTSTITATPTTTVTPSPTASPTPVVQLTPTPPDDGTGPNQANPPAP